MLRPTLPSSLRVQVDIANPLPAVLTDPVQLQQVIVNLCINARDAMLGSGVVRLSLRRGRVLDATCASCHGNFSGDFVMLNVTDDGPGIPPAARERIFEPFYSTKTAAGGTGMGLAMVHGIVHNHAGHVMLSCGEAGGARFDILLPVPVRPLITSAAPVELHAGASAPRPARVLVIDDEPAVSSYLAELLEHAGYAVQRETDARRALDRFLAAPTAFDVIVTDQTMPHLTGAQLAQAALAIRADVPVVLMTGYSASFDASRAHELGVRAFLHKPVSSDLLLDTVAALVVNEAAPAGSGARAQPERH
jgi:CheY-like chemotaxis protein